jgi:N-acetylmuramoyl-L-alanine amidase
MLGWTGLTVAAGWFAVQGAATGGSSGPKVQSAPAITAVARTLGAGATRAPSTIAAAVPTATPTSTQTISSATARPRQEPPPLYAQSAGAEGGAVESNVGGAGVFRDATLTAAKGVIVLDPGHGRGDPGAVHHRPDGTPDVLESESNLRNAQLIRTELLAMGYDVYLTRDDAGRGPNGPLVQQFIVSDLLWRVQLAAAVDADVYLALHGNGASVTSISGPETWYCGRHEQGSSNEELAAMVQRAMMDALHEYGYFPPDRGIMEDAERHHSGDFCQFVVTRENTIPSALLEYLFLSNDDDARVLADDRSHVILARHVAQALDAFLTERAAGR